MTCAKRNQFFVWIGFEVMLAFLPWFAICQEVQGQDKASSLKPVVFEKNDEYFRLDLSQLFSGQETKFVFGFKNGTSQPLLHVSSKVGCPCISVDGLDDRTIQPGEIVDVNVLIKPVDIKGFAQRIQIAGETAGERFECSVVVRAEVVSPVTIPTFIHTQSTTKKKSFDMIVHPSSPRVKIDRKSIALESDAIEIVDVNVGEKGEAIVSMSFKPRMAQEDTFSLGVFRVRFSIEGGRKGIEVEQRIRFGAYSGIDISPSTATFERDGESYRTSFIVRDHRTDEHRASQAIRFQLVPLESREDVFFLFSESEMKPFGNEGRAFVAKLQIRKEELDKIRSEFKHLMLAVPKGLANDKPLVRLDGYYLFKADFE